MRPEHRTGADRPTASDLGGRALRFVLEHDPDLAVEAGRLPPVLWEDVSERHRLAACEAADALLSEITDAIAARAADAPTAGVTDEPAARADGRLLDRSLPVARHHVTGARSLIERSGIEALNHMTGPAARLSWSADTWPVSSDPNAEVYVERLLAFPSYCDELARQCLRPGQVASRAVLGAFVRQVDALVEAHRDGTGPLQAPVVTAGGSLPGGALDDVLAGLRRLRTIAVEVAADPGTVEASPLPHLADGRQRYAEAVYRGTSRELSPRQLTELGQAVLDGSQRRFEQLRDGGRVGFEPVPDTAELLAAATAVHQRVTAALPAVCSALPVMPCEVVVMPGAHAAVGPPAYYGPSNRRSGRPGSLYVNTAEPVTVRPWELLPLIMHEGVPGHHLQLALLDEDESIPEIMRLLSVNAFTEGWAVYAETLGRDMGFDLTPAEEYGGLAYQRWRAARLVTDVGLHVAGWSVDAAVRFLADCTGQDRGAVRREIVRYLAWPGQALGYMVGAKTVESWVAARRAEGLPLADAHARLLRLGSVPLTELR